MDTYTVEDIHEMRIAIAERYKQMTPDEAERDFQAHASNARKTIEMLRNNRKRNIVD